ncbi:MAG: flagellar motor protein MotB [Candidatus Omnitrophica bacterium]|nr:flagellar motor protein MotB [Candidatus Omnitrophota bacterium]MDD5770657.1 flagellar motor protein MotB [Candidatus Omnitrophota bacterium]
MKKGYLVAAFLVVFSMSGCSYMQKIRKADDLEIENQNLKMRIAQLQDEKEKEVSGLEQAKRDLEESLKKEIGEYKAKLQMTERGLVITFVSEVFFDAGKDGIKEDGKETLEKVAVVLNRDIPDLSIAIEGHTDGDPIRHSSWKSNWELSSARALAVLHYLIDKGGVLPQRLSANGYGEFHPVAPNDTAENKQKNRRVEIVVIPSRLSKAAP